MSSPRVVQVAVAPDGLRAFLVEAVESGGGKIVEPGDAEAVVWADAADPGGLSQLLDDHPGIRWVQLPWAGIEPYVDVVRSHGDLTWSCAKGVYAEPVGEHALALALACRRHLGEFARAGRWTKGRAEYLLGQRVTIVGGGGIAETLLRLLGPFGCEVTVVRTSPRPMAGAARVVATADLDEALTGADVLVLALSLTAESTGLIDRRRLDLLAPGGVLVNVARGGHVVTDDIIPALDDGPLAGVGLDVTDPEPLPDGHPLWDRPEVIITPHTANTPEMAFPLLSARVTANVRHYALDEPLEGPIDPSAGY